MSRHRRFSLRFAAMAMGLVAARDAQAQTVSEHRPVSYPGVSARLEVPEHVRQGDSLVLRLTVRNETRLPITLPISREGDLAFDPIARDAKGRVVWERLAGQYLSGVGESRVIQPHQTITYRATWTLRDPARLVVPVGVYRVTGRLIGGRDTVFLSVADVPVEIRR